MRVSGWDILVGAAALVVLVSLLVWFLPVLVPVGLILTLVALIYFGVRSLTGQPPGSAT